MYNITFKIFVRLIFNKNNTMFINFNSWFSKGYWCYNFSLTPIFANQGLRSSTHTFSSPLVYLTANSQSPGSAI